jgi:glutamine synthetase
MEKSDLVHSALGDHVFEKLIEAQRSEWSDFRRHVSSWERDRYLGVY